MAPWSADRAIDPLVILQVGQHCSTNRSRQHHRQRLRSQHKPRTYREGQQPCDYWRSVTSHTRGNPLGVALPPNQIPVPTYVTRAGGRLAYHRPPPSFTPKAVCETRHPSSTANPAQTLLKRVGIDAAVVPGPRRRAAPHRLGRPLLDPWGCGRWRGRHSASGPSGMPDSED